jgi:hypothetical protein
MVLLVLVPVVVVRGLLVETLRVGVRLGVYDTDAAGGLLRAGVGGGAGARRARLEHSGILHVRLRCVRVG